MILVTGATGTVGSEVVRALSMDAAVPTRAFVRSPEKADAMRGYDCEIAVGNYGDERSLDDAFRDVDTVFLAAPIGQQQVAHEKAVIDAAVRAGARVVKLASSGWDGDGYGRIAEAHADIVDHLRSTGLPHTLLAPTEFLQNLELLASTVQESSVLALPVGEAPVSSVDARDVAAVAAHVLCSTGHDGAVYTVTGPEPVTKSEVAQRLSAVLGRPVTYVDADPAETRRGLLADGLDAWRVDGLLELWQAARHGKLAIVTDEVQKATGRPPCSVNDFLHDHRNVFA